MKDKKPEFQRFTGSDAEQLKQLFHDMLLSMQKIRPIVESYDIVPLRIKGLDALSDLKRDYDRVKHLVAKLNNTLWLTMKIPTVKAGSQSLTSTPSMTAPSSTASKDAQEDTSSPKS